MTTEEALNLFKTKSCTVLAIGLGVCKKNGIGIGKFTTGRVTEYNTVYLNEIDYYVAIWNILEVEIDGKIVPIVDR